MTQTPTDQVPKSHSGRPALDVAADAAPAAGRILRDRLHTSMKVSFKGRADIVTDVDLAAEKAVLDLLREEYPDFGILSEESKPIESESPFNWVVDPLDGNRNYASGISHFCTAVALVHDDQSIVGVIYDPVRGELFTAEKGKGAFLNGERLSVPEVRELGQALMSCDLGYVDEKACLAIDLIRSLWPGILSLRLMGSAALALAYAAAGRVDLYFHHSLSPRDVAAGLVLVQEAGGTIVDKQGHPANLHTPSVIASNPFLIDHFLRSTESHPWREGSETDLPAPDSPGRISRFPT